MKKCDLYYIASARLPTEKANGCQIVKMCDAFSRIYREVRLIVPSRVNHGRAKEFGDIYDFYGVEKRFEIKVIKTPDFLPFFRKAAIPYVESLFFILQENIFAKKSVAYLKDREKALVFTRSKRVLKALVSGGINSKHKIIYECHKLTARETGLLVNVQKKIDMIVAITNALKRDLVSSGVSGEKILVCPDGTDIGKAQSAPADIFDPALEKELAGKFIIGYAGSFFDWKGVATLLRAAKYITDDCRVLLAGGPHREFRGMMRSAGVEKSGKIRYMGYLKPRDVFSFIKACDLMVIPNSAANRTFSKYSSPLKLFEAMACGVPVIGSDLPGVSEIIRDGENGFLFRPDDFRELAGKIMGLKGNPAGLKQAAAAAAKEVSLYSWDQRAKTIFDALE
ncbi:glycosyltransferase family 4 protein [bacterium]|jgi:glycosyltransferase involved in cell wall biosynthesis|nr:glycosyltransferase family 4 protein [bacterium]